MCIVIFIPPRVELKSNYSLPTASNDSIASDIAVGVLLGGVMAGVIGVLVIKGLVCAACCMRRIEHK